MSVSMKDLQSSSDEEEELDYLYKLSKNETQTKKAEESKRRLPPSCLPKSNTFDVAVTNKKNENEKNDDTKKSWLKEQVSDSIKRISTRITPTPSLDSSMNDSFDDSIPVRGISKTVSESDIKSTFDALDGKENITKRQWFKGSLNSYISKSKNYYYNRGSTPLASSETSLNCSLDTSTENNETIKSASSSESLNNLFLSSSPKSSVEHNIGRTSPSRLQIHDSTFKLSSLSAEASHLPLFKKEKPSLTTKNTYSKQTQPSSQITSRQDQPKGNNNSNLITSKLTFSELLHSNSTPSSPTKSAETVDMCKVAEPATTPLNEDFTDIEIDILTDNIVKEDLKYHLRPNSGSSVTFFRLWVSSLFMYSYFTHSFPVFLSGAVAGAIVTYLVGCLTVWLLCPSAESYDQYRSDLKRFLINDAKTSSQPHVIKDLPKPEVLRKPRDLKGWINLAYVYNNTYEKELVKEVFVVVHEETMFIFLTKKKIEETAPNAKLKKTLKNRPKKQISIQDTEEEHVITFKYEYRIDLQKCSLHLTPDDLPIRRIWNKKYPLLLTIPGKALKKREITLRFEQLTLDLNDIINGMMDDNFVSENFSSSDATEEFFLFGNTGREKEDWFYRMQLCIAPLKHQVSFADLRKQRISNKPSNSYSHYITELITESEKVMQRNVKGKKMEPYLAWLNIFLGRAFWDFWHDKYWTDKLHQKIQSRLSKINTPPFIKDIKLKDLNCGHNIPIIHKGSLPVLDEYGVWTDLQITYKGYFTLTLETQLNVDYYVGLVSGIVKQKSGNDTQLSKMTKLSDLHADTSCEDIDTDKEGQKEAPVSDLDYEDDNFHDEIPDVYFDTNDTTDGKIEDDADPVMSDPRTKAFLESRAGKKVVGLVGWLAKSKLAKKVAETDFAKKAYEKAYEKFRKMPIILKVEVQSVKGNLAVNIPPPPTNRLWYGFRNNPVIFITASPKVGDKQVRLTYLTSWIEKKLKEEFKKYLVLPSMQDISIKLMDSQLQNLYPDRPMS